MKKIKFIAATIVVSLSLFSCNSSEHSSTGSEISIEDVANKKVSDPNASGGNKCLLAYAEKYDELLTEPMVLAATGFPKEKMKVKYSKVMKNTAYHGVRYAFDMGRVQSLPGTGGKMALPDDISIKGIGPKSLAQFNDSYRAMSAEDEQHFDEAKKDVLSGNSEDKDADKILKKAEEKGMDKKQIEKGVEQVGGIIKQIAKAYVVVDGLGDAARWNTLTKEMVVLKDGVQFELYVNVANEDSKNKTVATDLAKQILDKCK